MTTKDCHLDPFLSQYLSPPYTISQDRSLLALMTDSLLRYRNFEYCPVSFFIVIIWGSKVSVSQQVIKSSYDANHLLNWNRTEKWMFWLSGHFDKTESYFGSLPERLYFAYFRGWPQSSVYCVPSSCPASCEPWAWTWLTPLLPLLPSEAPPSLPLQSISSPLHPLTLTTHSPLLLFDISFHWGSTQLILRNYPHPPFPPSKKIIRDEHKSGFRNLR